MLTAYVLLAVCSVLLLKYGRQFLKFREAMNRLPGDDTFHPILGNFHTFPGMSEDGLAWIYERVNKYKYFHRVYVTPFLAPMLVYHPDTVRETIRASIKPRQLVSGLASSYDMGTPWLGDGLILTNGRRWHRNRRLLTPSFHFEILKNYMKVYNSCTVNFLENILVGSSKTGKSVDFQPLVSNYTLDVILRCAFSYHSHCQTGREPGEYAKAIAEIQHLWMKRLINPMFFVEFLYRLSPQGRRFYSLCDIAHREAEAIMKKRKQELDLDPDNLKGGGGGNRKARDFLDTLLTARDEQGNGLSWTEIREEVDTFLFAGHDTTASGIMWTLVSLARHPDHQELVYEEVKAAVVEDTNSTKVGQVDDDNEVKWEDLGKLQYTGQCIKEALRLHTAVPAIERFTIEDVVFDGHVIKKGTVVNIPLWALHHNPHVWDAPHDFQPQRFHPEKVAKMDPFQFIPFSAGSRNCIGQNFAMNEMKVAVAKVVRRFQLKVDEDRPVLREMSVTMKASHGAYLLATER